MSSRENGKGEEWKEVGLKQREEWMHKGAKILDVTKDK